MIINLQTLYEPKLSRVDGLFLPTFGWNIVQTPMPKVEKGADDGIENFLDRRSKGRSGIGCLEYGRTVVSI
jgi:hypothetical protein